MSLLFCCFLLLLLLLFLMMMMMMMMMMLLLLLLLLLLNVRPIRMFKLSVLITPWGVQYSKMMKCFSNSTPTMTIYYEPISNIQRRYLRNKNCIKFAAVIILLYHSVSSFFLNTNYLQYTFVYTYIFHSIITHSYNDYYKPNIVHAMFYSHYLIEWRRRICWWWWRLYTCTRTLAVDLCGRHLSPWPTAADKTGGNIYSTSVIL